MTTGDLLEDFAGHMQLVGYSPRTEQERLKMLQHLARVLAPRSLAEATRRDLERFLTSRPLKPESRRAYRAHLRAFYRWCLDEGHVTEDPSAKIPAIRVPRGLPRPITTAELSAAMDRADVRMRAWLLLGALSGLRCLEIAALCPGDLVHTDGGPVFRLRVTKGGAPATLPVHPRVVEALSFLPVRNSLWWETSAGTVSRDIGLHMKACGIDAGAHALRHYAGSAWFQASGHDVLATARLLRHQSIASTQIYVKQDTTRPAEVVNLVPFDLPGDRGRREAL